VTRTALDHGLRGVAMRRRLKEQRIADNAAGEHSHHLAVQAHHDWLRRRIAEALTKVADKPEALAGLTRLQAQAERGLSFAAIRFLQVIENRILHGEDIEPREMRQRPFRPSKRPDWMRDQTLLPKRPPGAT